jgi:hypothetical protein
VKQSHQTPDLDPRCDCATCKHLSYDMMSTHSNIILYIILMVWLWITHEITEVDKRTFYQFRDIERP